MESNKTNLKLMDVISLDLKDEKNVDIMCSFLARWNMPYFNIGKFNEELMEMGEVINKQFNKKGGNKPGKEKLIEELGDFYMRLSIAIETLFPDSYDEIADKAHNRAVEKLKKMQTYLATNKYQYGV